MNSETDFITYQPHLGSIRPDGNLRVPFSGRSEDGGIWDGEIEAGPEHPSYAEWRQAISRKEQHLAALREERMQARETLRKAAEWKRAMKRMDR